MLKCKQRLGIKKQFIMNRKRDANSNWYNSEVMKCRKLITATKASRIKPCWKDSKKLIYIYIFYEEQHSGIALLLDRDEKNICCLVHTNAMNLCSLFSRKKTPKMGCAYIPEYWWSSGSQEECYCFASVQDYSGKNKLIHLLSILGKIMED